MLCRHQPGREVAALSTRHDRGRSMDTSHNEKWQTSTSPTRHGARVSMHECMSHDDERRGSLSLRLSQSRPLPHRVVHRLQRGAAEGVAAVRHHGVVQQAATARGQRRRRGAERPARGSRGAATHRGRKSGEGGLKEEVPDLGVWWGGGVGGGRGCKSVMELCM